LIAGAENVGDQFLWPVGRLRWINLAPGEPGIISFYRQEAARKKHREGVPVNRIAAEAGTTPEGGSKMA
jgi:hypothetical protein